MGQLRNQFNKIIKNVVKHYAGEYKVKEDMVQLRLFLKPFKGVPDTFEAGYKIAIDYKPPNEKDELKIIEVIHPGKKYKIDFTGMSQLVHPYVGKTLLELCKENDIEPLKINVFCFVISKEEKEAVVLYLYNETNPLKRLNPATVFNDEKIVT